MKRWLYGIAAAACIIVLFLRFVPSGQVMAAQLKEQAGFAIYVDSDSFEMTEEEDSDIIRGKRIVYTREDAVRDNAALLAGLPQEEKEQKIREIVEERQAFYDSFPVGEMRITLTK